MKKKIINESLAIEAMEEFLNSASSLDYEGRKRTAHLVFSQEHGFASYIQENGPRFIVTYDFSRVYNNHGFSKDFRSKSATARGCANVTLILLHELGHFHTYKSIPAEYNREKTMSDIHRNVKVRLKKELGVKTFREVLDVVSHSPKVKARYLEIANEAYRDILDESTATNWAIQWLENKDHIKLVRAFERKFFSATK